MHKKNSKILLKNVLAISTLNKPSIRKSPDDESPFADSVMNH